MAETGSTLDRWERLDGDAAVAQLLTLCASRTWAVTLISNWTCSGEENFLREAEAVWFSLSEADWLEAFAAHPRIGEKKAVTTQYLAASEVEQSTVQQSLEPVREALMLGNRAYEERFGFRYIVFASGRTAPELLDLLRARLLRTRDEELHEAARQQHRITALRMAKWLEGNP